jgi:hypothetical protein
VAFGVVLALGLFWWQIRLGGNEWLVSVVGRGARLADEVAGVAYFLVALFVHRPFYRHMALAGIDSPSGWRVGIMAVVVSMFIYLGVLGLHMLSR